MIVRPSNPSSGRARGRYVRHRRCSLVLLFAPYWLVPKRCPACGDRTDEGDWENVELDDDPST